jgi:CRISPR-associated protein Csb2
MKTLKPVRLVSVNDGDAAVHYLYPLVDGVPRHLDILTLAARSITHLGWGIDMAVGDASVISVEDAEKLKGVRWKPSPTGGTSLRVPRQGTLNDLSRKHADFLNRVTDEGFRPVPPLRVFDVVRYRSQNEPAHRPFRLFELRNLDGGPFRYPHARLIHIAGMVRHLAINAMRDDVPPQIRKLTKREQDDWVETYVAGHRKGRKADLERERKCDGDLADAQRHIDGKPDAGDLQHDEAFNDTHAHRQLSYLPLPSIGHRHTDPGVRRVMIAAPVGDDALLDHVCRRLAGQQLKALNEKSPEFGSEDGRPKPGPILVPMPLRGDGVTRWYTAAASEWHSFTPVILPGHDDQKPGKTQALIERALIQAGIDQPCAFEWSAVSRFPKSYSAHKYDRQKRPQGYIRPGYMLSQTAVHLTLRFHDGSAQPRPVQVPGPVVIGAGRHCGLGMMVSANA